MFSYRHAFHAGNHADVLKHLTLVATLRHLMRKDGPLTLVDTHAGAGIYRIDGDAAEVSGEAQAGIARLRALHRAAESESKTPPAPDGQAPKAINSIVTSLQDYLDQVAAFNRGPAQAPWRVYPGSPLIMHALMTDAPRAAVHDRLRLFELHPTDWQALQAHVAQLDAGRQVGLADLDDRRRRIAIGCGPGMRGGCQRRQQPCRQQARHGPAACRARHCDRFRYGSHGRRSSPVACPEE